MTKSLINEIKAIRQQMEDTTTEPESVLEEVTGLKDELYEKLQDIDNIKADIITIKGEKSGENKPNEQGNSLNLALLESMKNMLEFQKKYISSQNKSDEISRIEEIRMNEEENSLRIENLDNLFSESIHHLESKIDFCNSKIDLFDSKIQDRFSENISAFMKSLNDSITLKIEVSENKLADHFYEDLNRLRERLNDTEQSMAKEDKIRAFSTYIHEKIDSLESSVDKKIDHDALRDSVNDLQKKIDDLKDNMQRFFRDSGKYIFESKQEIRQEYIHLREILTKKILFNEISIN